VGPMKALARSLYVQVLIAMALGVAVGLAKPEFASSLKPVADAFVRLVKMLVGPVVFVSVATGIGQSRDLKRMGRLGVRALVYFEVVSTVALLLGLAVGHLVRPGAGIHATSAMLEGSATGSTAGKMPSALEFVLGIVPTTLVDAFAKGDVLQVLFVSILVGVALARLGEHAAPVLDLIHRTGTILFELLSIVMRVAPIGAFAALGFTVGHFGVTAIASLAKLVACVYGTSMLFVLIVLGTIARMSGFSLLKMMRYLREELLLVLATSSSESALPRLMEKLERAGCDRSVVGLVVPTGYSFNLDGTSLYMTLATLFVAQATDTSLSFRDEVTILGVLLVTSKGAAGVTGSGFITLAATLAAVPAIPPAGLALLLGVDRFLSEARSLTNFIGNAVATLVLGRVEGALDSVKLAAALDTPSAIIAAGEPVTP
jgi:aerobic C4-dicarboxylate transport protein